MVLVLLRLERELLGGGRGEVGGDLSEFDEECGDWGGLLPCLVEEELEVVWRGERVWRDSWLLVSACCARGEDEQDLLRGVR